MDRSYEQIGAAPVQSMEINKQKVDFSPRDAELRRETRTISAVVLQDYLHFIPLQDHTHVRARTCIIWWSMRVAETYAESRPSSAHDAPYPPTGRASGLWCSHVQSMSAPPPEHVPHPTSETWTGALT